MLIYVAGPNDLVGDLEQRMVIREMRRDVGGAIEAAHGVVGFDPTAPYVAPAADGAATWRVNEAALHEADAVLALLPKGIPSVGTPMEIQTAHLERKPVAVIGGAGSMQLKGMGVKRFPWRASDARPAVDWLRQQVRARPAAEANGSWMPDALRWTGPPEFEPVRRYEGDAGFDLVCSEQIRVPLGGFADIPCGIAVELPPRTWALITGRSSTLRRRRLLVHSSVIDNGYRGPLFAGTWNLGETTVEVQRGERVAQLLLLPLEAATVALERVAGLGPSDRGENAFGSTGT